MHACPVLACDVSSTTLLACKDKIYDTQVNVCIFNAVTCTVTVPYCIIIEYPFLEDLVVNFRALHLQDGAD